MTTLALPARAARSILIPLLTWLAVASGHVVGVVGRMLPFVPGLAGAGLLSYAAWGWRHLLGYAVAGVFCLLVDRQVTLRKRRGE